MFRVLFYLAPLAVVLIVGPLLIARARNGASTWFPAQLLAIVGLVVAIVILQRGDLGDLGGPLYLVVLVCGAALGNLLAFLVLPRKKSPE